jgi:hypothetical protein
MIDDGVCEAIDGIKIGRGKLQPDLYPPIK